MICVGTQECQHDGQHSEKEFGISLVVWGEPKGPEAMASLPLEDPPLPMRCKIDKTLLPSAWNGWGWKLLELSLRENTGQICARLTPVKPLAKKGRTSSGGSGLRVGGPFLLVS